MKKKKRMFVLGISIFLAFITVQILAHIFKIPIIHAKRIEGSIPYHENSMYSAKGKKFVELSEDGTLTEYVVERKDAYSERVIRKIESVHTEPRLKYLLWGELFITEDNRIFVGSKDELLGEELGTVNGAKSGDVGKEHVAVLTEDGRLFVQGDNRNRALGIAEGGTEKFAEVPNLQDVVKVVCGSYCTFVLNTKGEVFLSGRLGAIQKNTFVKLDIPEKVKDIAASQFAETLVALDIKGNVYEMGTPYFAEEYYDPWASHDEFYTSFHKISKLKNISRISQKNGLRGIAINKNGELFCWGARMIGKSTELEKTFAKVQGIPRAEVIWKWGDYLYVLSEGQITAYLV